MRPQQQPGLTNVLHSERVAHPRGVRVQPILSQSSPSPQGTQSFRIVRAPTSAHQNSIRHIQQKSVVRTPTRGQPRSQPIPRHLVQPATQPVRHVVQSVPHQVVPQVSN